MSKEVEQFNLETIEVSMLPELQGWKEKQETIVKENPFVAIVDNKTYEEAKKARTTLVSARTTIEKQDKLIASKLKDIRTKAGKFSEELVKITLPHEEKQQEEVKRYETLKEEERLEKERLEKVRKDAIQSKIETIYQTEKLKIDNLTFAGIENLQKDFEDNLYKTDVTEFEEFELQFASKIQLIKQQLSEKISLLNERESQRIEAERLAKEKAEQDAKAKADAEKLAKEKAEFEAEKRAKEEADRVEREKREAEQKAIDDANAKRQEELDVKQKAIEEAEAKRKAEIEAEQKAKETPVAEIEATTTVEEEIGEGNSVIQCNVNEFSRENKTTKELIIDTISDLVGKFTYYDRKGDEDLTIEKLNNAVKNNEITIDEMVAEFKKHLESTFN